MNKLIQHWFSYAIIAIWLFICIIGLKLNLVSGFANKGLSVIGGEYYRFLTALFVHNNFLHLLANVIAIYYAGSYLESHINPVKLLAFSLLIGVITELIFAAIYKESVSFGGSPIIFALIGLIVALNITKADTFQFQLGTRYGNWILGYAILANIPLFSDNFLSTLLIHGIPFALGVLLGAGWSVLNWL